jgi:hypothetical protein
MSNRLPCHLYSGNKEIEASRLRQKVDHPQIIIIILYTSDNMTTVKCVNSASAVSDQLLHLTRRIHSFAALHDLNVLSRWAPGLTLIAEGSDDLSRSGRFAPKDRTAWQLSPALRSHWSTVMPDTPLILPDFHSVGPVLRDALLAFEHSSAPAAFVVPYWPQASWMPLLKRFTIAHEYAVGLPVLRHPDRPAIAVNSCHPLVVVRLCAPGTPPPSASQKRNHGRCVHWPDP